MKDPKKALEDIAKTIGADGVKNLGASVPAEPVVMWLKENVKFSLLTIAGFLPIILFLDIGMDIILFRDFGEWKGMGFVCCVVFYSEFCKKYRDT